MSIKRIFGCGVFAWLLMMAPAWATTKDKTSTADHTQFKQLQKDFQTGPEVTAACLECHTEASKQLEKTTHWTWQFDHMNGQKLGKREVVNSFCGTVASNEPRCTSCHIGYDWTDMRKDHPAGTNVDCLVCHDTTGIYKKLPTGAGHPKYGPDLDLKKIAQNVGETSRANCGACHFYGGGGDGVKHGDLDSSLVNPPKELDVHMSKDGANFTCATCHNPKGHDVPGSRFETTAKDTKGIDIASADYKDHATCESCHGMAPHKSKAKLNDHTDKVACQTCHIPEFARGGVPTKMWWDWSQGGKMKDGKPYAIKDDHGHDIYNSKKGDFKLAENVVPEYAWFDGKMRYTLRSEKIDDANPPVPINTFGGSYNDPEARIWPFKIMRGKQPYDKELKTFLVNHVFGKDDTSFWRNFDWQKALTAGTDYVGQPYSGNYGFVETTYHWPQTHMVAPKSDALRCDDCHAKDGRLAGLNGFYMPRRDQSDVLDMLGFIMIGLTGTGVCVHGLLRLVLRRKDKKEG